MVDIIHRVGVRAPVAQVYAAIATVEGVAGWWTKETRGVAAPGGAMEFAFSTPDGERVGTIGAEVIELRTDAAVQWRFTSGPAEWLDTEAVFRLAQDGEFTIVRFAHRRWREAVEFTEHCSTKWATFLMSLKEYVETGRGRPAPDDVWVGNWH